MIAVSASVDFSFGHELDRAFADWLPISRTSRGKTRKHLPQRQHPHPQHGALQFADQPVQPRLLFAQAGGGIVASTTTCAWAAIVRRRS